MKNLVVLLTLLHVCFIGFSQEAPKGNGKISGSVVDSESNQPVEFANVALIDPKTGKPVDGSVCDDKGKFTITRIAEGTYTVSITFIGYETNNINNITIDNKSDVNLGAIKLQTSVKVLKEVVVESQRQLIEEKVDRTIYNAENDKTTAGGDASDVLKRVPMLSVDMDGNVSMRGSQNITVLINNKPSTIMAANVADALKQIPADEIKTVEVITSPSAKYDAEGSAGIINIITKKNSLKGFTLNVNAGGGNRGANLGLNGNFRTNKMGFSLGGFGRANYNVTGEFENKQTTYRNFDDLENNISTVTTQTAETLNRGLFGNYTIGWDYDINAKNSLVASARFGARNGINFQDNLYSDFGSSTRLQDTESKNINNSVDLSLTYTRLFDKKQREFSILGNYSQNNGNNDSETLTKEIDEITDSRFSFKNFNDTYNKEATLQFDYQTPIQDNQILEFGAKDIIRRVYSDFSRITDNDGDGDYETSANSSNNLNYDQNIVAGYMSYTYTTKNAFSVKAGGRYEYTTIKAYTETESDIDIPEYGAFVPSINVSKRLKSGKTIKASYNRRIQRPSIRFLNPNIQGANTTDMTIGNAQLDPEYSNNFELSYSTFVNGTNINVAAFWRNTNNGIQSIRDVIAENNADPDTVVTRYRNIGQEDAIGVNLNANVVLGKLTLSGGGDVFYSKLDNNLPIDPTEPNDPNRQAKASNSGWVVSGRFFGNYNLGKGWGIQFFSFVRGRQVQLQGYQGGMGMYNIGIRKEFNDRKGSIGIGAQNLFMKEMRIKSEINSPLANRESVNILNNMGFNINFSYRFGKMSMDGGRQGRRRSINNDDLKDGSMDGGMDMNQGQPQQQQRGTGGPSFTPPTTTPKQPEKTASADTAKATVDATGTWTYTMETPQGTSTGTFIIKKDGNSYSGVITSARMNNQEMALSSVSVSGNELTMMYTANFGGNEIPITIKGAIVENSLDGTMAFGQFRTVPIKAKR